MNDFEKTSEPFGDEQKEKTHEEVMSDFEKFGMPKTGDFKEALSENNLEKANEWLKFIDENRKYFPQYDDSWFSDRRREIRTAEQNPNREWVPTQSKEQAKKFLDEKFGFSSTSGFREALKKDIEKAEKWLNCIIDNSNDFPQYHATWDSWVADRRRELEEASKEQK